MPESSELTELAELERILDLGCGTGPLTREIADAGARVIGIDGSPEMIAKARAQYPELEFRVADARSFAFPEAFDAVTCCGALQLFQDQDQAVGEIARVLKTQGDFVCQTTLGPRKAPLWVRMADRMLKFGYFYLDDLKERLCRFNFDLKAEERSNINYIFRAAKSG